MSAPTRAAEVGGSHRDSAAVPKLTVEDVDVSYRSVQVLFGVSIAVPCGEVIALLGTNGAGKSTLLKAISGLVKPSAGRVLIDGEDITDVRAEDRVDRSMMLVEGGKAIFPSLTVLENIKLGAYGSLRDSRLVTNRLDEGLQVFPELRDKLRRPAGSLSGGEQQMVALSRAIMSGADLLLIDELSLGLAPVVLAKILGAVEQIVQEGRTVLLVEQSLNVALGLARQAYFMEKGAVRFSGPTADLLDRGDLVKSIFFGQGPHQ